jgi:DeoR/GlpR family transcriptional regulator of sugar metabolism
MPTVHELDRAAKRREKVLAAIADSIATRGYPPTVSELSRAHEVSTLTTRRDLDRLVRDGKIERDPGVDRGLRLL